MGRSPWIPTQLPTVFSLEEAVDAGLTHSALRGRSWRRLASGLYARRGGAIDQWAVIEAWQRRLPEAVFVGRTAAWMHGLDVDPLQPVEVALPVNSEVRSRVGLEVRHCDVVGETVGVRGCRTTRVERALLDICARSSPVDGLIVLDMAMKADMVTREGLRAYARRVAGRRGAARLRTLADIAAPADSPMETRLRWLLVDARLPAPDVQAELYDDNGAFLGRADLYYSSAFLVIEFDGGNHRDRMVSDDRRQNSLVTAGYRVLRFTAADVHNRPAVVVATVRRTLRKA